MYTGNKNIAPSKQAVPILTVNNSFVLLDAFMQNTIGYKSIEHITYFQPLANKKRFIWLDANKICLFV